MLSALCLYLYAVIDDGDYANDWLTHLPRAMRPAVQHLGERLAYLLATMPHLATAAAGMVTDLAHCYDPTLPATWTPGLARLARLLAHLYDLAIASGIC